MVYLHLEYRCHPPCLAWIRTTQYNGSILEFEWMNEWMNDGRHMLKNMGYDLEK